MSRGSTPKRLRTFDEDDIVRYSLGLDVPIVGLVRDRSEYKEMREIALIHGTVLGLGAKARAAAASEPAAPALDAPEPADVAAEPAPAEPVAAATGDAPEGATV